MDLVELAHHLVGERFPAARAAVLGGSVSAGRATATSDLDIVVVVDGPPAPFRETIRVDSVPVELFVHTEDSLIYWFAHDRDAGSCTLAHMLGTGLPLAGDEVHRVQRRARDHVAAGPAAWTAQQLQYRRYALTDALDDLVSAQDVDERDVVAGQVLVMAAELALGSRGAPVASPRATHRAAPDLIRPQNPHDFSAISTDTPTGYALPIAVADAVGDRNPPEVIIIEAGERRLQPPQPLA